MKCTVSYSNGSPEREYNSIKEAAEALLKEYPEGVIYDAGGRERDEFSDDEDYDIRSDVPGRDRAALVWQTGEESDNDDGAHAVAEISVEESER